MVIASGVFELTTLKVTTSPVPPDLSVIEDKATVSLVLDVSVCKPITLSN